MKNEDEFTEEDEDVCLRLECLSYAVASAEKDVYCEAIVIAAQKFYNFVKGNSENKGH